MEAPSICLVISNWIMEKMNRLNFTTKGTLLYWLTTPLRKNENFLGHQSLGISPGILSNHNREELMDPNENEKTPSPPFFLSMYHPQSFTHLLGWQIIKQLLCANTVEWSIDQQDPWVHRAFTEQSLLWWPEISRELVFTACEETCIIKRWA